VYTHILNRRLTEWAVDEEKIIEQQAGFRAGYSTIDHIFTLYALVQKYLQKNTKLYVAFVDFKKAFDTVNRNELWAVLRKSGVNGKLYRAIKGIYSSVLACVRDKCLCTDFFDCSRGVKQGCLLSPMLFSFFVNELAVEISQWGKHGIQLIPGSVEIFLLLFADDVILLSSTPTGLQNQLDVLKAEADRLRLTVNLDKTNIMVYRMGGHMAAKERWVYGDQDVKVTNAYKYLGMTFTTKLCISSVLSDISRKGRKGVMEIQRSMRRLGSGDLGLFWKLFDCQIEPVLTYSVEVWGLEDVSPIEKVHTFAMKRFLNIPLHSSNKLMYGETGRYPLSIRTAVKCLKYWIKLTRLPLSRLSRQAYDMLRVQHNHGRTNWVSNVQKILTENGFGIVWLLQEVGCEMRFVAEFKDRLISCYKQNWHSEIESNEKYRWFHSFKDTFGAEKYLTCILTKRFRDALIRFRLRVCGLRGHKMWFLSEPSDNSSCPMCGHSLEDEIHFILKCPAYAQIRHRYRFMQPTDNVTWGTVKDILTSTDENKLINLSKFIAIALDMRKKTVELS
jgi:hypothetical protein